METFFVYNLKSRRDEIKRTPMVTIQNSELHEDRYSRFRLIPWWNQAKIASARVLVVGAGALGNEILKNLALLGFRKVVVVDLDRIEESNLSRTILYRHADIGEFKAVASARAYRAIAGDAVVQPVVADVLRDCGLGLFQWSDLILAGLDNREARLWINRSAWKVNRPWIDGAIEGINGVARVFLPGAAPCYECTLGEVDWAILDRRMSCNLLANEAVPEGKIPTTPTISSIIAGIQVQEAVKLIHGMPTLASSGFIFEGLTHSSYTVKYTENPDCMSHYTFPDVIKLPERSCDLSVEQLWKRAQADLASAEVTLEFSRDIVHKLSCPHCGMEEDKFLALGKLLYKQGQCPNDGHMRIVHAVHGFSGNEPFASRALDQLGLPRFDIFLARSSGREIAYLLDGDRETVMGRLATEGQ
jgi:adenylyltransferase/sulfurtransferase